MQLDGHRVLSMGGDMVLYSKSTGGFYMPEINGSNIPTDAVEITADRHAALLEQQSLGKIIRPDHAGFPVQVDNTATDSPVVSRVTMRQARLQLVVMGKYQEVCAAVEQMGDAAKIEWEYASDVDRGNPIVSALAQLLELDDAEVDEMFLAASLL